MSGQLHDVGSVVNFWPTTDQGPDQCIGIALVVTRRDLWVVKTELRMVFMDSGRFVLREKADG